MRLKKFKIENYKKIEDSGWIECGAVTGFVGKNESGKSALFRGLSKFNPSDGQKYNLLKEFPRRRHAAEHNTQDWPVSSVVFSFDEDDISSLTEICGIFSQINSVTITKHYSGQYSLYFESDNLPEEVTIESYVLSLQNWKNTINSFVASEGKGELLNNIKQAINAVMTPTIQKLENEVQERPITRDILQTTLDVITSNLNEQWQQNLFAKIVEENHLIIRHVEAITSFENAKDWIVDNMPKFIYFDKYDTLVGAVDMKDFVRKLQENPDDPKLRITKCLFQHVNLDINKLSSLNPNDNKTTVEEAMEKVMERNVDLSSAGTEMTERFSEWWEQRKHKFRYSLDGDIFYLWVSDDSDPSEIELGERSAGLQYFFSFYLVFLVEAKNTYKNSILLLDEPGLYYHGTAQKKTVDFLRKISRDNQLMYTTHSPFMIDGDHLEDIKIVYEDKGNTHVSSDIWPKDKDAIFPLQAGLGYSMAQTLFVSKYNLVVEGLTDYWVLKSMDNTLGKKKMKQLDPEVVIIPVGGVRNMLPLAGLLLGNKMNLAFLLDGDKPGLNKAKELTEKLSLKCILTSTFSNKDDAEIEDLFPESLYLKAVKKAYQDNSIEFDANEKQITRITKRTEKVFERLHLGKFEKWKVLRSMTDIINDEPDSVPIDTCKIFEKIFIETNAILKPNP